MSHFFCDKKSIFEKILEQAVAFIPGFVKESALKNHPHKRKHY